MAGGAPRISSNNLPSIMKGYIMLPMDVEKEAYIDTVFRTNIVAVMMEGGLFRNDVRITNEAINNIWFPEEPGEKGCQVIIASGDFLNQPTIIGTFIGNDEVPAWSEDIVRIKKQVKDVTMSMTIDPRNQEWNMNLTSFEKPVKFNVTLGGNEENKIRLQSSGEVEVVASKKVKITGYKEVITEVVNVIEDVKEKDKEIRRLTMNMEGMNFVWKTQDKTTTIKTDPNTVDVNFHDGKSHITMDESGVVLGYDNDAEMIQLTQNLIKLMTGQRVNINNAKEPLTLANTLIQLLNNVENQIMTLKNAWQTALAGSAAMDGGKAGFGAGVSAVAAVNPLQFDGIKSTVTFSD
jgi:hypothetical protein